MAFAQMPSDQKVLLFSLYLALLYIDAKDPNIRSLIVIFAVINAIFYELDWLFYILGKYHWKTGPIAGDAILDIIIMINFTTLLASIYYRSEIMEWAVRVFKLKAFDYLPTRADIIQIYVIRIIAVYHIYYFISAALVMNDLNVLNEQIATTAEIKQLEAQLATMGRTYVRVAGDLELFRHFTLLLLLHTWLKQNITTQKEF